MSRPQANRPQATRPTAVFRCRAVGSDGLQAAFADVEGLARSCRYGDCTHKTEPGCAVQEAVESGTLDAERLTGYGKLLRESAHLARKTDAHARMSENRRWKQITKKNRARTKNSKKR